MSLAVMPNAKLIVFVLLCVCAAGGCRKNQMAGTESLAVDETPLAGLAPGGHRQTLLRPSRSAGTFVKLPTEETGLHFVNSVVLDHPLRRIFGSGFICGGIAIGDVDQDGRPDIYCVSGPNANRLYLQRSELQFEDVTEMAGVSGGNHWGAGASLKDVDNDGDLDIYVCNYETPNQLFINNGHAQFEEAAEAFGIDVVSASLMSAFCDYDRDGDLDMYLLTNQIFRSGGRPKDPPFAVVDGEPRVKPEFAKYYALTRDADGRYGMDGYGQPDQLFENLGDGKFVEVTDVAGIQGNGFGLSATWWDYDLDGYPDLYVANDFDDPDCLYRNNGDGTFTDVLEQAIPHTSWFSMGADFGDLNNDGLFDFLVVDMSSTNHFAEKTTMGAMSAEKLARVAGPPPQIMRNALYLNSGTSRFQEAAFLAGLAESDWSWSVKIADYDSDGKQDVFITNGMVRNINHSDRPITDEMRIGHEEWEYYANTPTRPEQNLAFRNEGDLEFSDVSKSWGLDHVGMSYASATADLDGDGDLDIVVANLDEPVAIYRNDLKSSADAARCIVQLRGTTSNSHGLGAVVTLESERGKQVKQLVPSRGFLGDNQPILQFGLADSERVIAISVQWPSGHVQKIHNLAANRRVEIVEPAGTPTLDGPEETRESAMFAGGNIAINHSEESFDDFKLQPLLPNQLSQFGPDLELADVNGDGRLDLFLTGSAGQAGELFLGREGVAFQKSQQPAFDADVAAEDLGGHFFDFDTDGDLDLYVASGSVENYERPTLFQDRLYLNDGSGIFHRSESVLPTIADSSADVTSCDFDRDGDLDLFVAGRLMPGQYPLSPKSRILRNSGKEFMDVTEQVAPKLLTAGMVTSSVWADVDGDDWDDLMLTVEWGPVRYFKNESGRLVEQTAVQPELRSRVGWWNDIVAADFDHDGDVDFAATNFGLNTKYHASSERPALLYYGDFEQNGQMKLVEAEQENETWFPVRGKSCSTKAIPHLAGKFNSYEAFARASLQEIYTETCLKEAHRFAATELRSGILVNDGGQFTFRPLPRIAQIAPSLAVVADDFDRDGHQDIFLAHNFFVPQVETGRMDSGVSQLLRGDGTGQFIAVRPDESGLVIPGDARAAAAADIDGDGHSDLVVATNNGPVSIWLNRTSRDER